MVTSPFYTAPTLKLNLRVPFSHPGRRPEGDSSTLNTATALSLIKRPPVNTERKWICSQIYAAPNLQFCKAQTRYL